jgi:hypothetical protein
MATKKTTLMLDEGQYLEIRRRALERGQSVSSVVNEALSAYLAPKEGPAKPRIKLTVAEGGGWIGPVDLTSNSALFELLDEGLTLDQLR